MSIQMVPCRFCGTTTAQVEGAPFSKCDNCNALGGPQMSLTDWTDEGRDPRDWYAGHGIEYPHGPASVEPRHVHYHINFTLDVGAHLSHLFKRFFPKRSEQTDIDDLTERLRNSSNDLDAAIKANTPEE